MAPVWRIHCRKAEAGRGRQRQAEGETVAVWTDHGGCEGEACPKRSLGLTSSVLDGETD